MVNVLVPDVRSSDGAEVADNLRAQGHTVHACLEMPGQDSCVELTSGLCPLDTAAIDVAVVPGERPAGGTLNDGGLCAVRRRIPVVLVGASARHALAPWAAAMTTAREVTATVDEVLEAPLAGHSAAAHKALLYELRGQGEGADGATVEVFRRPGRLVVELKAAPGMTHTQTERLAAHVVQAVRIHDRWAPKIDVVVRAVP